MPGIKAAHKPTLVRGLGEGLRQSYLETLLRNPQAMTLRYWQGYSVLGPHPATATQRVPGAGTRFSQSWEKGVPLPDIPLSQSWERD